MDTIFSPQDVDALLPKLENIFQHMDFYHMRARKLVSGCPMPTPQSKPAEVAEAARIQSQVEFLLHSVQEDIALISQMGGVVKDLEAGLVDFPGSFAGDDVWLCWKRGENKVRFWHTLDSGFAQRRPLYHSEERPHRKSRGHLEEL
jgi:hypothetical protein